MSAELDALRAELAATTGPARLRPLSKLGQLLAMEVWRAGYGKPAGQAALREAVTVMKEAYGYLRDDDGTRGPLGAQLGYLLTILYKLTGDIEDRETGIRVLSATLDTTLSVILRTQSRILLGDLYLSRMDAFMQAPNAARLMLAGQTPPEVAAHVDQAITQFRSAVAKPAPNAEVIEVAKTFLTMAEMMKQMMTSTTGGGIDLQKMMDVLPRMQAMMARFDGQGQQAGPQANPMFFSFSSIQSLMNAEPLDIPLTYVEQEPDDVVIGQPAEPTRQPVPAAAQSLAKLHALLRATLGAAPESPLWTAAAALLGAELDYDVVNEVVTLGRLAIEHDEHDQAERAVDWFVLAAALGLRDRLDPDGDHADRADGLECLRTAATMIPSGHPAVVPILRTLGAFVDEHRPFGGALPDVAEEFADRIDAALVTGDVTDAADAAILHALRCLCRSAVALAELSRAPVPPDYPWHAALLVATKATG